MTRGVKSARCTGRDEARGVPNCEPCGVTKCESSAQAALIVLPPCESSLVPLNCAVVLRGQANQIRAPHWLLHKADGLLSAPATTEQQLEEAALLFGEALQLDGATPCPPAGSSASRSEARHR